MMHITEIINTDCYIDCGDNERLRQVVAMLGIPADDYQTIFGINDNDSYIFISLDGYMTCHQLKSRLQVHHINDIIF
jgi:hypothetical protein